MNYINDFIYVTRTTGKKAVKSILNNYQMIIMGTIYMIINLVLMQLIHRLFSGSLGLIGGLLSYLVSASIISHFLYYLSDIILYDRFSWSNFKRGFTFYLRKVYSILFVLWIGEYLLSLVLGMFGGNLYTIYPLIMIVVYIVLNPISEIIYLKSYDTGGSFSYSLEFIKENWIIWFISNGIFVGALYLLTGQLLLNILTSYVGLGMLLNLDPINILKFLLAQVIFTFMMIYRGHLFKLLSTSTIRKRNYMRKF